MSIVSFNTLTPGLVGVTPRVVQLTATDNLATVTTAGFLNRQGQVLQGFAFYPTDILFVIYSYVAATNSGTFAMFTPSVSATGVITLVEWVNPGNVALPVIDGHFANFNGTTGEIEDAGYSPTNAAKAKVAMLDAVPVVADNLASFSAVDGSIKDSGVGSAAVQLKANIKAARTANIGGAGAGPISVVVAGLTAASIVVGNIQASSNAASIQKMTATATGFDVLFSADPGATCTVNYVAFVAAQ